TTCCASCGSRTAASPRPRTPTPTASRASRIRGRRRRVSRPSSCSRLSTAARSSAGSSTRRREPASSSCASSARSRCATTRRSLRGTASPWPPSPRPAAGSTGTTTSMPRALARIYGDDELERRAVSVFRLVRDVVERAPSAFGWLLCALDLHFSPPRELAIVGPPESDVARAALAPFDPSAVVAFGPADDVPLLAGKDLVDGRPAVYVCERFACRAPVTDADDLAVTAASPE